MGGPGDGRETDMTRRSALRLTAIAAALAASTLGGCASSRSGQDRIVRVPRACQDQQAQVYFEPDSAELTAEGRVILGQAAAAARSCVVKEVQVLGLADAAGAPDANLEL